MSKALIAGINQVATDKGLDREIIFEAIEAALISAYKRNYGSVANVSAAVDRMSGDMRVYAEKEVVDGVMNPRTEIDLVEAKKLDAKVAVHDLIKIPSTPGNFGRIAAQTAKQVILQRIREAERDTVYENYVHRVGELINAQVRSIDTLSGTVTVLLDDKHESLLPRDEQIPNERLRRSDYIKLFVVDVQKGSRGPMIKLSRTHRNLLRRLMEQEIPEVREGTVEIKNIAREPGARSKVAVLATAPGVDAVGSCVGLRGMRIQGIVNELAGEKIDVVEWNSEIRAYIANALSPAQVDVVILEGDNSVKTATVVVPDRQLSLAIGKAGQNARLAAKLTGWRIDIKSESEALAEGYDLLAAKSVQDSAGKGDIFTMAQTILDAKDAAPQTGADKLRKMARMVEDEGRRAASGGYVHVWRHAAPHPGSTQGGPVVLGQERDCRRRTQGRGSLWRIGQPTCRGRSPAAQDHRILGRGQACAQGPGRNQAGAHGRARRPARSHHRRHVAGTTGQEGRHGRHGLRDSRRAVGRPVGRGRRH